MKFKFAVFTLSLLMMLTVTSSAFAQDFGLFNVYPSSEARGRLHGYGEMAGDITFLLQPPSELNSNAAADTITITYGARIDNDIAATAGSALPHEIDITICNIDVGDTTMTNLTPNSTKASISGNRLTLRIAGSNCSAETSSIIDVSGVRLAVAGEGQDSITASVRGAGAVRVVGESTFTIIRSIVDEVTDAGVKVKPAVTLIRHTGEPKSDGKFKLMITENAVDSFSDAEIELTFSGIPDEDDVELTLDAWVITKDDLDDGGDPGVSTNQLSFDGSTTMGVATLNADVFETTVTPATRYETGADPIEDSGVDETMGGMLSPTKVDVIVIVGSISGLEDDDLLPLGDITIQAVANIGPGSRSDTHTRFSADPTTPVTVIGSAPDRESLTFSLAISSGTFDTGIAVINTGKTLTGPITFDFYNMDGTKSTYTTSASSPGMGLTGGMLGPKAAYIVLLSELMSSPFTGHIVVTTDFTGAVGTGYITDFDGFSSAVDVNSINKRSRDSGIPESDSSRGRGRTLLPLFFGPSLWLSGKGNINEAFCCRLGLGIGGGGCGRLRL